MKATKQIVGLVMGCVFALGLFSTLHAQTTNLTFTSVKVGDEQSIRLDWKSETNAFYKVEYTSELQSGGTVWHQLYDDYPAHGTNTFWLDNGNYEEDPIVKRPKDSEKRFYRVVKMGTNTAARPFVRITSPASNAVVSGELAVSVVATSSLPILDHLLFLDGLEMLDSEDGTNYVINTCEWANGPHVLFAVAKGASGLGGIPGFQGITYGRAASPYIPLVFSNYISEYYFSEPFFEPSLGQTQNVSAKFAAYSDWTLQIFDVSSNAVRTATGSGNTMSFAWDGLDDTSSAVADGVHYYTLSAQETSAPMSMMSGEAEESVSPLKAALAEGKTTYLIQLPPLPPPLGNKDDSIRYMEVMISDQIIDSYQKSLELSKSETMSLSAGGGGVANLGGGSTNQTTTGPTKPPVKPVKGVAGTFGVVALSYPNSITNQAPPNGLFGQVQIEGSTAPSAFDPVPQFNDLAKGFARSMGRTGWKTGFKRTDANVSLQELQRSDLGYGGSSIFNSVNIGFFMSHGAYGTSLDWTSAADVSLQTYFPIGGTNPPNSWMRMSEFKFDGPNLRWMAILACNGLREDNYQSMLARSVLPIGDEFHFMCGGSTVLYAHSLIGKRWSYNMNVLNQTIQTAWYNAGRRCYTEPTDPVISDTVIFRIVGWDSTFNDRVGSYTIPDPFFDSIDTREEQVFP